MICKKCGQNLIFTMDGKCASDICSKKCNYCDKDAIGSMTRNNEERHYCKKHERTAFYHSIYKI